MKIIFNIISIFMVTAVIFLAYLNINTNLSFIIWKSLSTSSLLVYHSKFFFVILIVFLLGIITGACWAGTFYSQTHKKLKEYQRKLEKTSVQTDEESSKVSVLEEKIKTLEKALQAALDRLED